MVKKTAVFIDIPAKRVQYKFNWTFGNFRFFDIHKGVLVRWKYAVNIYVYFYTINEKLFERSQSLVFSNSVGWIIIEQIKFKEDEVNFWLLKIKKHYSNH